MTVFGGFILFLIVAAVALILLRVTPAYIENYTIKRILGDLVEESGMAHLESHEVRQSVVNRLKVSGIHNTKDKKITVKKAGGVTRVKVEYVVQEPIVGNVDVLISFSDSVELVRR
jgi:hypothetical protein